MRVNDKIREARKKAGITQKQLAKKLGVSSAMIAQYETGKRNPKMQTLEKIANALEIPVSDLYGDNMIIANSFTPIIHEIIDTSEADKKLWDSVKNKKDIIVVKNPYNTETFAAHKDDEQFTPEELEKIEEYKRLLIAARPKDK